MPSKNNQEVMAETLGLNQSAPKKKFLKRFILLLLIALPVTVAVMIGLPAKSKPQVRYKTEPIERGTLTVAITATGNLAPTNKVEVGCELSGIIKTVSADFNDRVKAGQHLVSLDSTKFEAAVMESQAALALAEARSLQARTTLLLKNQTMKRLHQVQQLSGGKAPSKGEMDAAEADLQRAKADETAAKAAIQQAQARLQIDQNALGKTTISSPIDGVVLKRFVDPGQTVAASLQTPVLFTLAEDLAKMELRVDVDEADVGLVEEQQAATFTVEAHPNRSFTARVTKLRFDPQINNGVVTYPAVLTVDNEDLQLRPGMTATVKIVTKQVADAILIPNAALRFTPPRQNHSAPGKRRVLDFFTRRTSAADSSAEEGRGNTAASRVWVLDGEALTAVTVTPGLNDGAYTAMADGDLEPGMQVVVEIQEEKP
jgi:HlyD family secretion protein